MLGVMSVLSVGAGSALAFATKLYPLRAATIETCAGVFLIVGLGLLGSALPHLA